MSLEGAEQKKEAAEMRGCLDVTVWDTMMRSSVMGPRELS